MLRRSFGITFLALLGACATSSESASRDALTAHVGVYAPPPAGTPRARVGVPPFATSGSGSGARMNEVAADQMTTLAVQSMRFDVIERAQLDKLLAEQGLQGVVKDGELAASGAVSGVDFLLLGKVTNFRVKGEKSASGFGLGKLPIPGAAGRAAGLFDYKNTGSTITAECGVDLRLVDPSSGRVAAAHFGEFKRTDAISSFGIEILGAGAHASASLEIDEDNKGKLLRLALDDALRKMLPMIDNELRTRAK